MCAVIRCARRCRLDSATVCRALAQAARAVAARITRMELKRRLKEEKLAEEREEKVAKTEKEVATSDEKPSPFLSVEKIDQIMRDEKRALSCLGLSGRVSWTYFDTTWTYGSVKHVVFGLARCHTNFYIGIATSIVWRWSEGHAVPNDDFVAHKHRWTGMAVLAADNGVMVLEEMLLEDIQTDPVILAKCHNACHYVPGPLATGTCVFLHMCFDRLAR